MKVVEEVKRLQHTSHRGTKLASSEAITAHIALRDKLSDFSNKMHCKTKMVPSRVVAAKNDK